jgi:hypothetical protein
MRQRRLPGSSLRPKGAYWINGVGTRCSGRRAAYRTKPRAAMTRPQGGAGAQLDPQTTESHALAYQRRLFVYSSIRTDQRGHCALETLPGLHLSCALRWPSGLRRGRHVYWGCAANQDKASVAICHRLKPQCGTGALGQGRCRIDQFVKRTRYAVRNHGLLKMLRKNIFYQTLTIQSGDGPSFDCPITIKTV